MSPAGAAQNSGLKYLHLPNGQDSVVKYDDLLCSFKLRYPKLASINVSYFIPGSLSRTPFNIGSLCTGLISDLLSLAVFRHNLTYHLL